MRWHGRAGDQDRMRTFTRRGVLLTLAGTAAAAGLAGAGGVVAVRSDWFLGRWITALIRGHLPQATIAQAEIDAFVEAAGRDLGPRHQAVAAIRTMLPGWQIPVASLEAKIQLIERKLLSDFMVASNVFSIDPDREAIEYLGPMVCGNPFARFDQA